MAVKIKPEENVPKLNSTDSDWIMWHKAFKAEFGKKQANLYFLKAWKLRNKDGLLFSGKANTTELRDYLKSQGISVEQGYLSYVTDLADDTMDMFTSIMGTARTSAMVVGAIVLIVLVYVIVQVVKRPQEFTSAFTSIASRGLIK